jgi:hypothetical protein
MSIHRLQPSPRYGSTHMPKSFKEFSARDWYHLRPLTQTVKSLRYEMIDNGYRRRPARAGDAAAIARSIRRRKVLVTIAFSDPALASWQIRLVRHYVPDARHVIADKSPADRIAAEIGQLCGGAVYVRAPENPWSADAPSRSHGLALNWAWENPIKPGEPEAFGFLDHDIFPTAPDDPFAPLASQDVYGVMRTAESRWFLWAGFCMFRFAAVREKRLNFGQDWFVGLDTGGGNWRILYEGIDGVTLLQPQTVFFPFKSGITTEEGPLQWCGTWLHEVGLMGDRPLVAEKRRAIAQMLVPHLERTPPPVAIGAV